MFKTLLLNPHLIQGHLKRLLQREREREREREGKGEMEKEKDELVCEKHNCGKSHS